uniref:CTNNB1 binding N-teminal domain-containing protein n=1 Tax=Hucho hucho TaxID=62062 RepID=A0A4W5RGL8_9TELE
MRDKSLVKRGAPGHRKHLDMYNKGHPYSGYPGYIMMTNMNNDSYMNNGSLSPPMPRTVSLVTLYLHQSINHSHQSVRLSSPVCVKCIFTASILNIQWGKKVFSQPPIVQVLSLKKMREACNFHHRYTSTMTDKMRKKNPENHIVGFLMNLFANYGGK